MHLLQMLQLLSQMQIVQIPKMVLLQIPLLLKMGKTTTTTTGDFHLPIRHHFQIPVPTTSKQPVPRVNLVRRNILGSAKSCWIMDQEDKMAAMERSAMTSTQSYVRALSGGGNAGRRSVIFITSKAPEEAGRKAR